MQNFIELRAAVYELSCVDYIEEKNSDETIESVATALTVKTQNAFCALQNDAQSINR